MRNQTNEEREWGFGQILALLLLLVPLRDAWVALRTIESNVQQRFEQAFRTVVEAEMALKDLSTLLDDGARPWKLINGRFGHFMQLAAHYGRRDLIEFIIDARARDGNSAVARVVNAVGKVLFLTLKLQFM